MQKRPMQCIASPRIRVLLRGQLIWPKEWEGPIKSYRDESKGVRLVQAFLRKMTSEGSRACQRRGRGGQEGRGGPASECHEQIMAFWVRVDLNLLLARRIAL